MTFSVTLKDLRAAGACVAGYNKVVCALQGVPYTIRRSTYIRYSHLDEIPLEFILTSNDLADALWATRCVQGHDRDLRLFAVWCARQVQHMSTDARVEACLDIVEQYAKGAATRAELDTAWAAAEAAKAGTAATGTTGAAEAAAEAAAGAVEAAGSAGPTGAVWATTEAAAWAAARAAEDDGAAAWAAAKAEQTAMFLKMLKGEAPWQENQV